MTSSAKPRFKDQRMQAMYETMLRLAQDKESELYWQGEPRRGSGHRAAFWDGASGRFDFTGPKRSANVIPGTLSAACFRAGEEFARLQRKADALQAAPRPVGRPAGTGAPPEQQRKTRSIRLSDARWQKLQRLGVSSWLERAIDRAREPKAASGEASG
jgi:hypothetical protein